MAHGFRKSFILVLAVATIGATGARAQQTMQSSIMPNPFHALDGWGQLPGGPSWGSVSAISVDKNGNVWVGDRCGKNDCSDSNLDPIIEFDSDGKFIRSFGGGMFTMPHAINFDKDGNFWFTDYGNKNGKGSVAIKFSPEGKILMTLGKAGVSGAGTDTFGEPDAVVEGAHGDLFVADGHTLGKGNARIVKFTKDGKYIKEWGEHGSGPGQFEIPHDLAIDSRGRILVADRGNKRIQIFDQDGKFLEEWKQFGTPSGLFIDRHDMLYVSDSWSQSTDPTSDRYKAGFEHGFWVGSAKNGKTTSFTPVPATAGGQNAPEGITADEAGNIYVADTIVKGVKKFVKQ